MKILNIFFCIIFIVFAGLQYNDPDPYVWIGIYGYTAALCGLAAANKFYPGAYWAGIIIFTGYALYKLFDENGVLDWLRKHNAENIAGTMKAETPWVEETREFFGLVILIAVLLVNHFYARKKSRIKPQP